MAIEYLFNVAIAVKITEEILEKFQEDMRVLELIDDTILLAVDSEGCDESSCKIAVELLLESHEIDYHYVESANE